MDPASHLPTAAAAVLVAVASTGVLAMGFYLAFQVLSRNLESTVAMLLFTPLAFCWAGILGTYNGPNYRFAEWLAGLGILWCLLIPLQSIAAQKKLQTDMMDDRIAELRELVEKTPNNPNAHFRLAEAYEDKGWWRDAYEAYSACLALEPHNLRAKNRGKELFAKIARNGSMKV